MRKIQSVMTVRLPKEDLQIVKELSSEEKIDKSTMVRELVELGKIYFAILKYKEGKISIGRAAEISDLPLSEMMDVLTGLGIESKLEIIDYLEGSKNIWFYEFI